MGFRFAIGFIVVLLSSAFGGTVMAQSGQPYFDAAARALQRNDLETAKEKILQGLAVEPDHANAMVNLANIYFLQKNYADATKYYDRALKIDPNNATGLNGRAILYLQDGKLDKAIELFVAATKADPSNPTPVVNLGDTAFTMGDSVNAIRYYAMALQIDPANERASIQLAELHAAAGPEFADKAISYVEPVLKRNPKNVPAMAAMGKALAAKGNWLRAIDYLYDAAQAMPKDVPVRYTLGVALMNTSQFSAAADAFLEALDLDDADPRLHLQLGIAYYMMRNPELRPYAQKEFQHVLDRNPTADNKSAALYHMGLVQDDAGKLDDAMKLYGQALKYDPKNVGALNNVGLILAQQGRFQDAIPYYQRALVSAPAMTAAQFNLGYAYYKLGKKAEAKTELTKLMSLPDSDPFKAQARQLLQGSN